MLRFSRYALRAAAALQLPFGVALAALAAMALGDAWPPRGPSGSLLVALLVLGFVVGLTQALLAIGLWHRRVFAWWASVFLAGALIHVAMLFSIFPVVLYLGVLGMLLVFGWASLTTPDDD